MSSLRTLAEAHGRSIEDEARHIIEAALDEPENVAEASEKAKPLKDKARKR